MDPSTTFLVKASRLQNSTRSRDEFDQAIIALFVKALPLLPTLDEKTTAFQMIIRLGIDWTVQSVLMQIQWAIRETRDSEFANFFVNTLSSLVHPPGDLWDTFMRRDICAGLRSFIKTVESEKAKEAEQKAEKEEAQKVGSPSEKLSDVTSDDVVVVIPHDDVKETNGTDMQDKKIGSKGSDTSNGDDDPPITIAEKASVSVPDQPIPDTMVDDIPDRKIEAGVLEKQQSRNVSGEDGDIVNSPTNKKRKREGEHETVVVEEDTTTGVHVVVV